MLKTAELSIRSNKPKGILTMEGGVKKRWCNKKGKSGFKPSQQPKGNGKSNKARQAKAATTNNARAENHFFYCNEVGHYKCDCPKSKNVASTSNQEGI